MLSVGGYVEMTTYLLTHESYCQLLVGEAGEAGQSEQDMETLLCCVVAGVQWSVRMRGTGRYMGLCGAGW